MPIPQGLIDGNATEGTRGPAYVRYYVDGAMADDPRTNEVTEVRGRIPETQALEEVVLSENDPRCDFEDDTPTSPETPIARGRP